MGDIGSDDSRGDAMGIDGVRTGGRGDHNQSGRKASIAGILKCIVVLWQRVLFHVPHRQHGPWDYVLSMVFHGADKGHASHCGADLACVEV